MRKNLLLWEFVVTVVMIGLFAVIFSIQQGWGLEGEDRYMVAFLSSIVAGIVATIVAFVASYSSALNKKIDSVSASIAISGIAAANATLITMIVVLLAMKISAVITFVSVFAGSLVTFLFIFSIAMVVAGVNSEKGPKSDENRFGDMFLVIVFAVAEVLLIFAGLFFIIFVL